MAEPARLLVREASQSNHGLGRQSARSVVDVLALLELLEGRIGVLTPRPLRSDLDFARQQFFGPVQCSSSRRARPPPTGRLASVVEPLVVRRVGIFKPKTLT